MQAHGEANADTCAYNDLALVKVDPADVGKVNPSSLGDGGGGWSHTVYTVTPGIPGDSGSAFLSADGKALGVLSTVALAPLAGSNGVGDLAREARVPELHRRLQRHRRHRHRALPGPLLAI